MNDEEKQELQALAQTLILAENFVAGVIAGAAATLLAAAAYGITVAQWPFSYGFAAVSIGIIVGLSIGFFGRGISRKFAVVATTFTIAGYFLGNVFKAIVSRSVITATSPFDVIRDRTFSELVAWSMSDFSLIDLVYLAIAVYFAVFLAMRSLSRSERLAIGLIGMKN